ncbi:MAG: hypothetical protein QOG48_948 [Verrucomicrobiota bacterium]|jgi:hypothetical protein
MRIVNRAHLPWFLFVVFTTLAASWLYVGNFAPENLPSVLRLPDSLVQKPSEHRSVGGTPLGLIFGTISLSIFVFAALLGMRKKLVLWRVGTVQRWLRAHIWLTLLTIPLVILHTGFRLGGPMTTLLVILYIIVMVSGIYGLTLQHYMPAIMMDRLPAESVYEQIPHIRAQLIAAANKMRESFKPAPSAKSDAGAPAPSTATAVTAGAAPMASTAGDLSTPTARAKSVVGSTITAESVVSPTPPPKTEPHIPPPRPPELKPPETMGTPTARVPEGAAVPAGTEKVTGVAPPAVAAQSVSPPTPIPPNEPAKVAPVAKPVAAPPAKAAPPTDADSEAALLDFLDRQVLPYLSLNRGERHRLGKARFSQDTFRYVKLRITEAYRDRVEEMEAWCEERRMLDLQTKLHHWMHGWLFIHAPISFLLLLLTLWHAYVTLFHY